VSRSAPAERRTRAGAALLLASLWPALCGAVGLAPATTLAPGLMWMAPRQSGPAPDGPANVVVIAGAAHSLVFGTGQADADGRFILRQLASHALPPAQLALLPAALPGYVFGASALQAAGVPVGATDATAKLISQRCDQCLARLHEREGAAAMAGSRVPVADTVLAPPMRIDLGDRPVRLIALGWAAVPGELALFDEATATLVSAEVVCGAQLPRLHDADLDGWLAALTQLEALAPGRILPGRGGPLPPAAIGRTRDYLLGLREAVARAYRDGLGLAGAREALRLPGLAPEDAQAHAANVQILYLKLEAAELAGTSR
jgi:glyoxylase-like metal-dependent hydrolase (beta-lactamase superfamily II)